MVQDTWRNSKYSMQMFVSTSEAMQRCWSATDALFAGINDWSVQPIDVRHPFGFYYGHLASFAKLKTMPKVSLSALPCPAPPCPALPCPALPCPALPLLIVTKAGQPWTDFTNGCIWLYVVIVNDSRGCGADGCSI